MSSPADVAAIAGQVYAELGPILGVHSPCRVFTAIATGAARALDVPYAAVFDRSYDEDGQKTAHYWLEIGGQRLDLWQRQVRLR